MLAALSIRNIVLIEKLDLEFLPGMSALTGETGAGKSILLDSLGLALGARGDASLVREGAEQGQVSALFELPAGHPAIALAKEYGIESDGQLLLRRVQGADGRSRAFVNDAPVSVAALRSLGAMLVEIHGQHDDRALADISSHRALLDAFGGHERELEGLGRSYEVMKAASKALEEHRAGIAAIRERAGYLAHVAEELRALDPRPGEEEKLAARRQVMMGAEKLAHELDGADKALSGGGAFKDLAAILRRLERQPEGSRQIAAPVAEAIERIMVEAGEARSAIANAMEQCAFSPADLEKSEERLFALREAGRKYRCPPDELPAFLQKAESELAALEADEEKLARLEEELEQARSDYLSRAAALGEKRRKAAKKLDQAVNRELAPLRLEKALFITKVESDEERESPLGHEQVVFHVRTNPGSRPGPMFKVASGGELSRFILALKAALAAKGSAPVLIFDEIDKGVGGATASAIGERLLRLGQGAQVFAVTHAPQIAAIANQHLRIAKSSRPAGNGNKEQEQTITMVEILPDKERREEIARMLSGAKITPEARAAASRLMAGRA